jgi:glycosyltransferase involved in cell wall biosynthesis
MGSFVGFMLLGAYAGLRVKGVDAIYATSTPLTVGVPALILHWAKRIPLIFEVRDQWPEIPIEMGIIKNRVLAKTLLWLERIIYRNSAAIVALSPGMSEGVRFVAGNGKAISVITNGCDTEIFRPDIDGTAFRKKHEWTDKLVLLHFGAMGKVNGLGFIIDVAERVKHRADIHFVLIGDGAGKKELVEKVAGLGIRNVELLDSLPRMDLVNVVAACDVSMVIIANYPILEHNSANKLFDSLSAGKPVLLNYRGWQGEILEANDAGFGCNLCDIDEFIEKILYISSHRNELTRMGRNARVLAERHFNRDKLANEALDVVCKAAKAVCK